MTLCVQQTDTNQFWREGQLKLGVGTGEGLLGSCYLLIFWKAPQDLYGIFCLKHKAMCIYM